MVHEKHCQKSKVCISKAEESYVCDIFKMLGDPGRLRIVCALMGTEMCVAHLAEQLGMEQSALSHQLQNLKRVGLIKSERIGRQIFYSLDDTHVSEIISQALGHVEHTKMARESAM